MNLKDQSMIYLIFCAALIFIIPLFGCSPTVVMIGSPYERYDHNRTQKIEIAFHDGTESVMTRFVVDEVYVPYGSRYFPIAHYKGKDDGMDRLPAANLVPIFTGIALPLSDEAVAGGRSDRKDLIDFLALGPLAKNGVEPGDTAGNTKSC